jgi:hypothetical protein
MIRESIADLDELIIRCRNQAAKEYISEAVACYKSGAYRSCIVATWIAFTFDFISKINELGLSGDKNANNKVVEFETIRQKHDVSESLKFEKNILDMSKEFELLSPIEYQELVRLFEDRNRCAHPSMISVEEPYNPSAELARYHIRNAVTYFLQRPPVQGKVALDRIMQEIDSGYFPTDYKLAVEHFRSGPLARAKDSLIRNLIIILTKNLLLEQHLESWRSTRKSALRAVYEIYPRYFEQLIKDRLSTIINSVTEEDWDYVIDYISLIPISWDLLEQDKKIKVTLFIEKTKSAVDIAHAVQIGGLKPLAMPKIKDLNEQDLGQFIKIAPILEVTDLAVNYFVNSRSFNSSYSNFNDLILPLHSILAMEQIKQIVVAFTENNQIYPSRGITNLYSEFYKLTKPISTNLKDDWRKVYQHLNECGFKTELQTLLKVEFPDIEDTIETEK